MYTSWDKRQPQESCAFDLVASLASPSASDSQRSAAPPVPKPILGEALLSQGHQVQGCLPNWMLLLQTIFAGVHYCLQVGPELGSVGINGLLHLSLNHAKVDGSSGSEEVGWS